VGAVAAGQLPDRLDALGTALGDDVGGAPLHTQVGPDLVPAHEDDPLGPEPLGGQHGGETDGAVADDRDGRAWADPAHHGGVVAGEEDVRQREQRRQQVAVLTDAGLDQGAVGQRDAHRLGLPAADVARVPEPAGAARRVQALPAEVAGVVGDRERGDDEVAHAEGRHLRPGLLDHADELVPDRRGPLRGGLRVVGVQVAAADARADHPHQCVRRLLDHRVGQVLHPHVTGAVDDSCAHEASSHQNSRGHRPGPGRGQATARGRLSGRPWEGLASQVPGEPPSSAGVSDGDRRDPPA
jgi:hypothetical protein